MEEFCSLVFVNLDPAAESLASQSGDLGKEIENYAPDLGNLTFAHRLTYKIQANWKTVIDNFLRYYHCPTAHRDFVSLVDMDTYQVTTHDIYSSHMAKAGLTENSAYAVDGASVTGGGRGIGRAIVDLFYQQGATLITCGRGKRLEELNDKISWQSVDVSSVEEVQSLSAFIIDQFGRLDILVNNAGIQIEKTVLESSDEDWDLLMGINAKGVFVCCRELIPIMINSGGGSVINIGSISANHADPSMALYNGSKAFVHGLTRSIAVDHGVDGIRCNAIAPGWIMTEMADAAFELAANPEAARKDAISRQAVRRFGKPEDIANTALWLASNQSSFASGQIFTIDGGLVAASPLQPGLF